jgi:hypothetical protein
MSHARKYIYNPWVPDVQLRGTTVVLGRAVHSPQVTDFGLSKDKDLNTYKQTAAMTGCGESRGVTHALGQIV